MKVFKSLLIGSLLVTTMQSFAQDESYWYTLPNPEIKKVEDSMFLDESNVSLERDENTGIDLKTYNSRLDKRRFSISYLGNSDIREASEISTFEILYAKNYESFWLEFVFARTTANNRQIFEYNTNINSESDALYEESSTINEFGVGAGLRTTYLQFLYDSRNVFETISATLNYVSLSEGFYSDDYKGLGIKSDYGIHYRLSEGYHFGLKLSYHVASIKKDRDTDNQPSLERSLIIDWLNLGFEFSFYY
ncbi:MAG: hypothetical protein ACPGJV_04040 [Bacteriovoracaceae bacterium]